MTGKNSARRTIAKEEGKREAEENVIEQVKRRKGL